VEKPKRTVKRPKPERERQQEREREWEKKRAQKLEEKREREQERQQTREEQEREEQERQQERQQTREEQEREEQERQQEPEPAQPAAAQPPVRVPEAAPEPERRVAAMAAPAPTTPRRTAVGSEAADAKAHEAALETFIRLTESDRQPHGTDSVDQGAVRAALARTAARKKPGGERLQPHEGPPEESPGGPPRSE
jgi:hypothetical protein